MTAISAITRTFKSMADGSLRFTIEVSPQDAKQAFDILGTPDVAIAIARLTQESTIEQAQKETIGEQKGGFLSQWLAIRCTEQSFWDFIEHEIHELDGDHNCDIDSAGKCDVAVKELLQIQSKKELDNDPAAEQAFHQLIRLPYSKWLAGAR